MRSALSLALALCAVPAIAAAQLTIVRPANDTVVNAKNTPVSGGGVANGSSVAVTVGGTTKTVTAGSGGWTSPNRPLAKGDNVIRVRSGTTTVRTLAVRSHSLAARGRQQVFFQWDAAVDEQLRRIARGTLTPVPSGAQLATFVTRVRARTQEVFADRYSPFDIQVVAATGPNVHTIHMTAISDSIFGSSPPDCGSIRPGQTSTVHVGTYRASMVNGLSNWRPMQRTDSLDTRIEDVGQALGRTTTHEIGHSLGLVGCGWMKGCEGGHNCSSYDANQGLANRFDHGRHIMDPGGKTFNHFRIAEPSASSRATARQPSRWETFGRSYLSIVHPGGSR